MTVRPVEYRIDQHGPYRRWIVVRNGVDMSGHDTLAEAQKAVGLLRADEAQAIEARQGQDAKRLDRNDESAVGNADAPKE